MILRAATLVPAGRALILGAGACDEIPLEQLAARFSRVTINDIAGEPMERALAALPAAARGKVEVDVADLTGATAAALERIEAALVACGDAEAAIARMSEVVAGQAAGPLPFAGHYDLIVASALLSQLHIGLTQRAAELFERRFAGQRETLRAAPAWTSAVYEYARRVEQRFVDELIPRLAGNGILYASESVQMCYVELTADGQWATAGTYRMLRSRDLQDYFDARFTTLDRGRWQWVVSPPARTGDVGRLYDVQALVLRVAPAAC
jgi:hypothetical protein